MRLIQFALSGLSLFSAILLTSCSGTKDKHPDDQPNFLLIQMDDLGYDDIGVHGNPLVHTPTIDQLADSSVCFTQFYVNPVCAATRASLLTGRNFLKTGVSHVHGGKDFLNLDETTLAELMQNAGYKTAMWGKWHSGHASGYFPWERGFDEAYMAKLYKHEYSHGLFNGKPVEHGVWADEALADYAIDFIERNKDKAFFAYLSTMSCHAPLEAPQKYIDGYLNAGLPETLAKIYAMIEYFDVQLQRVFNTLDELNLREKTVIIFLSDNGPQFFKGMPEVREIRYINKLKGHKGNILENGVRSPLFVSWSQQLTPGNTDQLADVVDILPTILDLAGIELPEDNLPIDGQSVGELLYEKEPEEIRDKISYNYAHKGWQDSDTRIWKFGGFHDEYRPMTQEMKDTMDFKNQVLSIRNQQYKLMQNAYPYPHVPEANHGYILVDMVNDPTENSNVIKEHPDIAEELKAKMADWFEEVREMTGSFNAPTYFIGLDSVQKTNIHAKSAFQISPELTNGLSSISGWSRPGSSAKYQIDVIRGGKYQVTLTYKDRTKIRAEMAVSVNRQTISAQLEGDTEQVLGVLDLAPGAAVLVVELIALKGESPAFMALEGIRVEGVH